MPITNLLADMRWKKQRDLELLLPNNMVEESSMLRKFKLLINNYFMIKLGFTGFHDMVHMVRTAYDDLLTSYGGDLWCIPIKPPSQGLGQGNGCAPCSWVLVST
eukprot:3538180-Ditylum_brightwellii.AAC.2